MSLSQIVLYGLLILVVAVYLRRFLLARSLTRYAPSGVSDRVKQGAVLLDVRTDRERSAGSIKGSVHIPLHELSRRADELAKYKGREIICFCQTGSRSLAAAARLRKLGHTVADLEGGMSEWRISHSS